MSLIRIVEEIRAISKIYLLVSMWIVGVLVAYYELNSILLSTGLFYFGIIFLLSNAITKLYYIKKPRHKINY